MKPIRIPCEKNKTDQYIVPSHITGYCVYVSKNKEDEEYKYVFVNTHVKFTTYQHV